MQEDPGQQASEPREGPKPLLQVDAEPAMQHNSNSWTHIEPVQQDITPIIRFDPIPTVSPPLFPLPDCHVAVTCVREIGSLRCFRSGSLYCEDLPF